MAQDYNLDSIDIDSIDSDRFPDLAYMLRMREIMRSVGIPQDAYKLNIDEDMATIAFDSERYRINGMVNKLEAVELCEPGVGGTGNFVVSQRSVNLDRDGNVVEGRETTSFDNPEDFAEHMRSAYAEHVQAKETMRGAGFEPIRPFVRPTSQARPYEGPTKSHLDALREQSRELWSDMHGNLKHVDRDFGGDTVGVAPSHDDMHKAAQHGEEEDAKYPDGDFDGDAVGLVHKYGSAGGSRAADSQIDFARLLGKDVADKIEQPNNTSTAERISRVLGDDGVSPQQPDDGLSH